MASLGGEFLQATVPDSSEDEHLREAARSKSCSRPRARTVAHSEERGSKSRSKSSGSAQYDLMLAYAAGNSSTQQQSSSAAVAASTSRSLVPKLIARPQRYARASTSTSSKASIRSPMMPKYTKTSPITEPCFVDIEVSNFCYFPHIVLVRKTSSRFYFSVRSVPVHIKTKHFC